MPGMCCAYQSPLTPLDVDGSLDEVLVSFRPCSVTLCSIGCYLEPPVLNVGAVFEEKKL